MQDEIKKVLENILDAKELAEIQMFLERPALVEAVRKVLFYRAFVHGVVKPGEPARPDVNYLLELVGNQYTQQGMVNNEALGADLRAKWEGVRLLQNAFNEISNLKKVVPEEKVKENKAR